MKKSTSAFLKATTVAFGLALAVSASAQIKIYPNGHIGLGNVQPLPSTTGSDNGNIAIGGPAGTVTAQVDTTATMTLFGKGLHWSGGRIAFGGRGDVWIGESKLTGVPPSGTMLKMQGAGGFSISCGSKYLLGYSPDALVVDAGPVISAGVSIQAPQFLTTSDARLKNNISSLEEVGELVEALTPVSYTYKDSEEDSSDGNGMKKVRTANSSDKHRIYGFLAQEVREILPDLVYEDQEGMLSIDYQGFIPVLVDAVKGLRSEAAALRQTIEEQNSKIERLENGGREPRQNVGDDEATLSQNRPNPFRSETEIKCHLPENVADAFICIYDLNGNQKKRIVLTERGDITVTVSANSLNAGLYLYSLIADGVEVDSKRMILTD